jgi:hypothetical protein
MFKVPADFNPRQLSEAAIAAPRQMWLAGLGATVVTRDWVQTEAAGMFKTLVKEGTVVESRAIRFLGERLDASVNAANRVWKRTRRNVETSVKKAATATADFAEQMLPKSLPMFELPETAKVTKPVAKRARKAKRTVRASAVKAKRKVRAAARA